MQAAFGSTPLVVEGKSLLSKTFENHVTGV